MVACKHFVELLGRCCGSCSCFCCCGFLLADFWTWSPAACCCELTTEPKKKNIAATCSSSIFTYPNVRQCFAITVLLSSFVSKSATFSSLLTLRTRSLWDLISSCTHNYATSMCYNFPIPCLWRMCSVAFASMASTGFFSYRGSLSNDTIPFDSDAPNAARYSSASALLFPMTFCFRVYAYKVCPPNITTPALDDFRVSLQPVESRSVNTVSSSTGFPYLNTCAHCLSRFRYLTSLYNLARLC